MAISKHLKKRRKSCWKIDDSCQTTMWGYKISPVSCEFRGGEENYEKNSALNIRTKKKLKYIHKRFSVQSIFKIKKILRLCSSVR